ncbi:MAG: hypothetical protein KDA93_04720 [Planctomycetaceae bacterium]|nr:hypothetical protein [Planctomycetaceae bacterium]
MLLIVVLVLGCEVERPPDRTSKAMTGSIAEKESNELDAIYILEESDMPWGDYGSILVHGMSAHLGRRGGEDGPIQLERTGPFVPPITFPGIGDIIVTNDVKQEMVKAGFRGIRFRPVEKARIVEVRWEEWDLTAPEPPYYPEGGEPEGFILNKPHSAELAAVVGDLWEVVLSDSAEMVRHEKPESLDVKFTYVEGSWNGSDLFSVPQNGYKYASARAKAWLEKNAGEWVSFRNGTEH